MMNRNDPFTLYDDELYDDDNGRTVDHTRVVINEPLSNAEANFDNLQLIFDREIVQNNEPSSVSQQQTNLTNRYDVNTTTTSYDPNIEQSLPTYSRAYTSTHVHHHGQGTTQVDIETSSVEELPICQSYSDIEESTDLHSPTRNRFLAWFSKKFILPQTDNSSPPIGLDPQTLWSLNYREAAIYLEEGFNNDKFDYHPQAYAKLPVYMAVHNHAYYMIDLFVCLFILSLAIFEKPAVSGYSLIESMHASMELFGLAIISVMFWLKFHWMGGRYFIRHKRTIIKLVVLGLMIIEALVVFVRQDTHFRVTRSLRPVFLIDNFYFGGVRRVIRQTIQSIRSFIQMLLLLMFFLVFFSISAFYLFSSIENYEQFSTIWNSFISLFVLLTTSNFPDVMMPAYKHSQFYPIFFIFFLIVNLYFLLNIMLAVVYNTFSQIEKDKFRKLFLHRRKACEHAFRLLVTTSNNENIKYKHFCGMLDYLQPNTSLLDRYLMYKALVNNGLPCQLDTNNVINVSTISTMEEPSYLNIEKFYKIYEVLYLGWRDETHKQPWFENVSYMAHLRSTCSFFHLIVSHRRFNYFTYTIIMLATCYQLLDAIIGYERWQQQVGLPTSASTICAIFIGLYTIELTLKFFILGYREFFHHRWNWFDTFITIVSLVTFLLAKYHVTTSLSTSFFSFRALRLIDLLRNNVKRYNDILGPFAFIIIKRFTSVTLVVLIVYYFFAIIAMECFGSYDLKDCCKNTSIEAYYSSSGPAELYYYLNNFSDLITSYITLFELMVVNSWQIIMKSYVTVTGTKVATIFFILFYMISLLVITIVIAFVIDTIQFQIQYKHRFAHEDTLSAKIKINVLITLEELQEIMSMKNFYKEAQNTAQTQSTNCLYGFFYRLFSPFPPSSAFHKVLFKRKNFDRLHSILLNQVRSSEQASSEVGSITNNNSDSINFGINISQQELVQSCDSIHVRVFSGSRFRDKFSYNLRMYSDEIQRWIQ